MNGIKVIPCLNIVSWAKRVEELGTGGILLTIKDADGTKEGYDLEITKAVAEAVSIPVTASGMEPAN
jgi:cyclase